MVMHVRVKVEGLRQLGDRFKKLSKKMQLQTAGRATSAAARVVKKAAITEIRTEDAIDTELLVSAVIMKRLSQRDAVGTAEHIVTIKKKVYAEDNPKGDRNTRRSGVFIEYGTVKLPPRPYLRTAFEKSKHRAMQAMVQKLREELERNEV